jgi:RND family efflux transporter MFP subunit
MIDSTFILIPLRRQTVLAMILVLSAGFVGSAPARASDATGRAQKPVAVMTVSTATASRAEWPVVIETSGAVMPWQEAIVSAQVGGLRLAAINVSVGDHVKRGQVLARYEADLLQADAMRLKASLEQAEADRQRALQLKGSGGISEQEILKYETQAEIARAQLQSTQLQIGYANVVAPDDGVVNANPATLGAVSSVGQELFRLIRKSRLEWRGELTAAQMGRLQPGMKASITLPDGSNASGVVRQIAPSLDAKTRLGLVYVDLQSERARAGMYLPGVIALQTQAAIVLPSASVVVRDGHSYVYLLGNNGHVRQQAVSLGRRQATQVEILSGVTENAQVVVKGAGFLNDGDLVSVSLSNKGQP